jgi:hypothetical protein
MIEGAVAPLPPLPRFTLRPCDSTFLQEEE